MLSCYFCLVCVYLHAKGRARSVNNIHLTASFVLFNDSGQRQTCAGHGIKQHQTQANQYYLLLIAQSEGRQIAHKLKCGSDAFCICFCNICLCEFMFVKYH